MSFWHGPPEISSEMNLLSTPWAPTRRPPRACSLRPRGSWPRLRPGLLVGNQYDSTGRDVTFRPASLPTQYLFFLPNFAKYLKFAQKNPEISGNTLTSGSYLEFYFEDRLRNSEKSRWEFRRKICVDRRSAKIWIDIRLSKVWFVSLENLNILNPELGKSVSIL